MRAIILAAGKGARMLPLTVSTPKPLLAVKGKSLLEHHLEGLANAGINELIINTWYMGEKIVEAIGDGARYGVKVRYSVEEELLNTGGGIVKALPYLEPDPFIVLSADIFTDFPIATLPSLPTGLAHLVMVENPEYHIEGDFQLEKGRVLLTGPQKKTYANIGVYRPEFFATAPQGNFPLGDLLRKHIAGGLVTGQYYAGDWHNVGTPHDLQMVNAIA